jgi:hypothetical protein
MPTYTVQGPDGRTYTIEGPAGASAEDLGNFIKSQAIPKANPSQSVVDGMGTGERLLVGAGKSVADLGLGLRQLAAPVQDYMSPNPAGQPSRAQALKQEYLDTQQRDAPLMNTGAGLTGNIGGQIATALLPGGVVGATGKVLSKLPAAADLAQALMTGGRAIMAPTSIPSAAAVGAAQGAVQPTDSGSDRLLNMAVGGGTAAAIPTVVRGLQVGKALLDPFSEAGQNRIIGRTLNAAAGSPADAAAARSNLSAASKPFVGPTPDGEVARQVMGEIVPGSLPTAGQAAGVPSLAALERTATAVDPTANNAMTARMAAQNTARSDELSRLAGSDGRRDFMAAKRTAQGNDLYGQARNVGIDPAALTPEAQANIASFQSRVPDDVLQRARDLAKINGVNMDNESSVQGLHWIKTAIDDKINTATRSGDTQMARAYQGLQNTLLDGLDQLSPAYGQARREFAAASRPINEMDVVQSVADKATNPLTGQVQPQAFARALSDKTAASTLGRPSATLENTLQPRTLQALQNVQEDLARANAANTGGRGVGSDTVQKLAFTNLMQQSGLPGWVTGLGARAGIGGIAQKIGQVAYRDANQEMSARLAQALLDPQSSSALMEAGMVTPAMQQLANGARRGGAAIGAMVPALLNR